MAQFCWSSSLGEIPARWDLRRAGWDLCDGPGSCDVHLAGCSADLLADPIGMVRSLGETARLVVLGIDDPQLRATLLAAGCGEVLGQNTGLAELAIRAGRLASRPGLLPRLREAGPLTLDLLHRDGRVDDTRGGHGWLALHPREFALAWRLAEGGGRRVSRAELLRDVWRIRHEPETNSIEVHVSRLRAKLAARGLTGMVQTDPSGGYRLAAS